MKNIYYKLCILIVISACSFTKASGQISKLKEVILEMNKVCPIKVDEITTQTGFRYESGYVIIDNVISIPMAKKELEKTYGTQIFRDELLKAYTQLSSIRSFTKMVIDANAGLKVNYTSSSGTTQTISFSPNEIKTGYYGKNVGYEENNNFEDVKSYHNLGMKHLNSKDFKQAFYYFIKAAELGYTNSQTNVALCYEQGWGVEQDFNQAELWYKRAIDSGDNKNAPLNLGGLYIRVKKYQEAVLCLINLAKSGDILAQSNLGMAYLRLKNYEDALYWETKAANAGDHSAENNLGIWYLNGLSGFPIDYDKAVYWNERAAKAGKKTAKHNLRIAQFKRGEMLYKNSIFDEAFNLFLEAANNSDNPIPGAFRQLSACYRYGKGTNVDEQKAKYYWEEAVKYNDEVAMEILGITDTM